MLTGVGQEWAPTAYGEFAAKSTPTYRAVTLRAKSLRAAPIIVNTRLKNGSLRPVSPDHPAQRLMTTVNPWWTAGDLIEATEMNLSLWGSAFWFIETERPGQDPKAIWSLRPDHMKIVPDVDNYIKGFLLTRGREEIPFLPEEIVWFRYINPVAEYAGLSPVAPARLTLEMGRDALTFNSAFFKNGAMPQDLVFMVDGPVTQEQSDSFYDRLRKRHADPKNAHLPLLWDMSQGKAPQKLGLTQREMEFMKTLNYTIEDAARVWGVPPPLMMSQESATYNNVKEARIQFHIGTIAPEWDFFEQEINEMLFKRHFKNENLVASFDRSMILPLKEAMSELDTSDLEKVKFGALTINEYRRARNLPDVKWGNIWWAPGNPTPVEDEESFTAPTPVSGPSQIAPEEDDEDVDPDDEDEDGDSNRSARAYPLERLEAVSRAFSQRLTAQQRRFIEMQRSLFNRQRKEVIRLLRLSTEEEARAFGSEERQAPRGGIFNMDSWAAIFRKEGRPLIMQMFTTSANQHASDFGLGTFDALAPAVTEWVDDRTEFWLTRVNAETAELLIGEISEGVSAGESIRDLEGRVEKVFRFNNSVRAERIARTESLSASNQGHLETYAQSGIVDKKEWITTIDGRERDAHRTADGQQVDVNDAFIVDGESLPAPGIGGSAGNVISCRCTVVPILVTAPENIEVLTIDLTAEFAKLSDSLHASVEKSLAVSTNGHNRKVIWENGLPVRTEDDG